MTTSAAERVVVGDEAMQALGRAVAAACFPPGARGGVIALSGHLGAGKTTFVKGLAEGLGVAEAQDVVSPTFLRMVAFERDGRLPLVHVDAWRMNGASDLTDLGLDEAMAGAAAVAIEWPERVADGLPSDHLAIAIEHTAEDRRTVRITAGGPRSRTWLARLDEASRA